MAINDLGSVQINYVDTIGVDVNVFEWHYQMFVSHFAILTPKQLWFNKHVGIWNIELLRPFQKKLILGVVILDTANHFRYFKNVYTQNAEKLVGQDIEEPTRENDTFHIRDNIFVIYINFLWVDHIDVQGILRWSNDAHILVFVEDEKFRLLLEIRLVVIHYLHVVCHEIIHFDVIFS